MKTWIEDDNGNRCSVEYFGSEEAARAALASLKDCYDCWNCYDCWDCSRCSDCSGCSSCSRCLGCSGCSDCSRCLGCSSCSSCLDCSGCSVCSYCLGCYDCSDCLYCSRCSRKSKSKAKPPAVPIIPEIHAAVYAAASAPAALEMEQWHTCGTTHCRAGWVVALAGEAGAELERFFDTELAAMMIYDASDPSFKINPARFYDSSNE